MARRNFRSEQAALTKRNALQEQAALERRYEIQRQSAQLQAECLLQGETGYPLTSEEWVDMVTTLKPAETLIAMHLKTLGMGQRWIPLDVEEIGKALRMNPETVVSALKRIHKLGYFTLFPAADASASRVYFCEPSQVPAEEGFSFDDQRLLD